MNNKRSGYRYRFFSFIILITLMSSITISMFGYSYDMADERRITNTPGDEGGVRISNDSDGHFHLVYQVGDGSGTRILYRKIDSQGNTLAGPFRVTPQSMDSVNLADIEVDSMGRVHIAFSGFPRESGSAGIYYAQFNKNGKIIIPALEVHVTNSASRSVRLDVDSTGNAYLVWRTLGEYSEIFWSRISPSGSISEEPRRVSEEFDRFGSTDVPAIGVIPEGTSYIVWTQQNFQRSRWVLYYTSISKQGEVLVSPREAISDLSEDIIDVVADADDHGNLHVAYVSSHPVQGESIHHAVLETNGELVDDDTIESQPLGDALWPDISVLPSRDAHITLMHQQNRMSSDWDVRLYVISEQNRSTHQIEIATSSSDEMYPAVSVGRSHIGVVYQISGDLYIVSVSNEVNNHPIPLLTVDPPTLKVNEEVTFDGSRSTDPDPEDFIEEYFFDWGDGSSSEWIQTPVTYHTYDSPGEYTASLRVKDSQGLECLNPATITVSVTDRTENSPPIAVLAVTPATSYEGELITLSGESSVDEDGSILEYSYIFGDGGSSGWTNSETVLHSYDYEGEYTAILRVRDNEGLESTPVSQTITILHKNAAPSAIIESVSPNPAYEGDLITFKGNGVDTDGTVVNYMWTSDVDGIIDEKFSFTTQNLSTGAHIISFQVMDDGDIWSEPDKLTLTIYPNRDFTIEDVTRIPNTPTPDTRIEFKVIFTDLDNDKPNIHNLLFRRNGEWNEMTLKEVNPDDHDYSDGKEFYIQKRFQVGEWDYRFEFDNDFNAVKTSEVGNFEVEAQPSFIPGMGILFVIISFVFSVALNRRNRF